MFAGRKIYVNRTPSNEYEKVIDQNASQLMKVTFSVVLVVLLSFSLIGIGPIYKFIFHGEYNSMTGGLLPFTTLDTLNGFLINTLFQFALGGVGIAGNVGVEIVNCMVINTCTTLADLLCNSMKKFSAGLVADTFTVQNKSELRDIFIRLNDLEDYIREFNEVYYWKFFLQPIRTVACVSLAILAQFEVCSTHLIGNNRIEFIYGFMQIIKSTEWLGFWLWGRTMSPHNITGSVLHGTQCSSGGTHNNVHSMFVFEKFN